MEPLLRYSCRHRAIQYPIHMEALERISLLHQRAQASGYAGGLLMTGYTGSGKSTVKKEYAARFPRKEEVDRMHIPVLCVDTPTAPTAKSLAEAILIALGDPMSYRGTAEQKTQRIYRLFQLCRVELLIIDEFQQFLEYAHRHEVARVTDWLKNLLNNANVPVVLMGLPYSDQVLRLNVQLARRFSSKHALRPFDITTPEGAQQFRGLLSAIERKLPLPSPSLIHPEMATRFYYATYGLIDFVGKLIDGAVVQAYRYRLKRLDETVFATAFEEEVWREVPKTLNPFIAPLESLRLLNRPGEPFALIEAAPATYAASTKGQKVLK